MRLWIVLVPFLLPIVLLTACRDKAPAAQDPPLPAQLQTVDLCPSAEQTTSAQLQAVFLAEGMPGVERWIDDKLGKALPAHIRWCSVDAKADVAERAVHVELWTREPDGRGGAMVRAWGVQPSKPGEILSHNVFPRGPGGGDVFGLVVRMRAPEAARP